MTRLLKWIGYVLGLAITGVLLPYTVQRIKDTPPDKIWVAVGSFGQRQLERRAATIKFAGRG
jgi:hypothetical protein